MIGLLLKKFSLHIKSPRFVFGFCIAISMLSIILCFQARHLIFKKAEVEYTLERKSEFNSARQNARKIIEITHDTLKAISVLPSIRDLRTKNVTPETRGTVQEFYNILFNHVQVSELYLVPIDMDPHSLNPKLHPKEPIATWDTFISNKWDDGKVNQIGSENAKKSDLSKDFAEEESFEYDFMKRQLSEIREKASINAKISMMVPSMSPFLITCDNSELTSSDVAKKDHNARLGMIYSHPVLDRKGAPIGMISAVIRKRVFERSLGFQSVSLNWNQGIVCGLAVCPNDSGEIIYSDSETFDLGGNNKWVVRSAVTKSEFESSEIAQKANFESLLITILIAALTLLVSGLVVGMWLVQNRAQLIAVRMTKEITQKQEELVMAARLSSLGEMTSSIAHEINNPTSIVRSYAEQLLALSEKNPIASEEVHKIGLRIEKAAIRISKIVRGIKTLGRNASKDPMEAIDINIILEDIEMLLHTKFIDSNVTFEAKVNILEGLGIKGRATEIGQVLVNLISNAVDAIQEFKVGKEEETARKASWVHLVIENQDENMLFRVSNGGPKIPNQVADKLFVPFYTTKGAGKGTGLGLSICRKIAADHQGELVLNREASHTEFVVRLPIVKKDRLAA
ncbi:MAG: ATP-binding protein [Pseudomonadota bacterium]